MDFIRILTDIIYVEVFNYPLVVLQKRLQLQPVVNEDQDEQLRDHMGTLALQTLNLIETDLTVYFEKLAESPTLEQCILYTQMISHRYAERAKQEAKRLKIDLLTGTSQSDSPSDDID